MEIWSFVFRVKEKKVPVIGMRDVVHYPLPIIVRLEKINLYFNVY